MEDGVPRDPETGDPTAPSNPDLFGKDPFYDGDERSRFAAWALALCVVLGIAIFGGGGYMFGIGKVSDESKISPTKTVTETITATPEPQPAPRPGPTVTVTRKSQVTVPGPTQPPKTVITTKTIAPQSTLTAYRTLPGIRVTVRATITRTAFSEPSTAYRCFRVRRDGSTVEIGCP